jgi:hypothetical protein
MLLGDEGLREESLLACRNAIALDPKLAHAHEYAGRNLMQAGDLAAGLPEWEWRLKNTKPASLTAAAPAWCGEDLEKRTLLVLAEQGIGDQINFGALIEDVLRRGVRCLVQLDPRLAPLLRRSFPAVEIVGPDASAADLPPIDYHVPVASLWRWLRPSFDLFPRHAGYLRADEAARDVLRQRYRAHYGELPLIGISWRGGSFQTMLMRSIALDRWLPILRLREFGFVSLQYGDCAAEIAALRDGHGATLLHDASVDPLRSMDDLAAQVAAMDLVISIDNSTVHMAGALGVPVWVLLPYAPNWRWLLDREDSPWYPSARLIRQPRADAWDLVIETVRQRLAAGAFARDGEASPAARRDSG